MPKRKHASVGLGIDGSCVFAACGDILGDFSTDDTFEGPQQTKRPLTTTTIKGSRRSSMSSELLNFILQHEEAFKRYDSFSLHV